MGGYGNGTTLGAHFDRLHCMMIQFASPVFLLQMLHNIFGHNTDCDFLGCCVLLHGFHAATVLLDLLTEGQASILLTMWSSETVSQDAQTSAE